MIPAGNKAKRLLLVNHTTKTIYHRHHHHQEMSLIAEAMEQLQTKKFLQCDGAMFPELFEGVNQLQLLMMILPGRYQPQWNGCLHEFDTLVVAFSAFKMMDAKK